MLGSSRLGFFTSGIFPTYGYSSGVSEFQFLSEVKRFSNSNANIVHSKLNTILDDKKGPFINYPTGNIIDFSNFASNTSVSHVVTIYNPVSNTSITHDLSSTGNISLFSNGNIGAVCLAYNGNIYATSQAWGDSVISAQGTTSEHRAMKALLEYDPVSNTSVVLNTGFCGLGAGASNFDTVIQGTGHLHPLLDGTLMRYPNYSSRAQDFGGSDTLPIGNFTQGYARLDLDALDRTKTDLDNAGEYYHCFTSSARFMQPNPGNVSQKQLSADIGSTITVGQSASARYNRQWTIIPEYTQSDFQGNVWSVSAYEMYTNNRNEITGSPTNVRGAKVTAANLVVKKYDTASNVFHTYDIQSKITQLQSNAALNAMQTDFQQGSFGSSDSANNTQSHLFFMEIFGHGGIMNDGRVVFPPRNGNLFLLCDPASNTITTTTYGLGLSCVNSTHFVNAIMGPDGNTYCLPNSGTGNIVVLNGLANTATTITNSEYITAFEDEGLMYRPGVARDSRRGGPFYQNKHHTIVNTGNIHLGNSFVLDTKYVSSNLSTTANTIFSYNLTNLSGGAGDIRLPGSAGGQAF